MNIEDRITKAKIWLITKRPWFGQLSCYLNVKENKKIPTACIDIAGNLYYNPDWMDKLTDEQIRGILCHEVLHLALQHIPRCGDRQQDLWNVACDLKVNMEVARESGMDLTKNCIKPESYGDQYNFQGNKITGVNEKTAENLYVEIRKKMKRAPSNTMIDLIIATNNPQEKEELEKAGIKPIDPGSVPAMSRSWQSRVYSAGQIAKGDCPAGVARELYKLENSELPWHNILKQRFRKMAVKQSWKRPSKRFLPFYFPGRTRNEGIKVVAAVDTSGSMSREQITKAISEMYGLTKAFPFMELWVCDCDAAVYEAKKVKPYDLSKLLLSGGGGTDFRPVFNWVRKDLKDDIDCLLFFTDLMGTFPDKKPPYETFWITDTKNGSVPFGRKLVLEVENQ